MQPRRAERRRAVLQLLAARRSTPRRARSALQLARGSPRRRAGAARRAGERTSIVKRASPGNHVDRAGQGLDAADGADQVRLAPRRCARPRARTRRRRRARRGACPSAPCPRGPRCPSPSTRSRVKPLIAGDHADRQAFRLQHRSLLDVQLDVGEHFLAAARGLRDRVRRRARSRSSAWRMVMPAASRGVEELRRRTCPRRRGCRAASCRSARPPRRRSRPPRSRAAGACRAACSACTHSIAVDDAQHAVVLAGIAHRVEVRAEHEAGQAGPVALVAADDVADRIEARGHARLAHPAEHELARGVLLAGEEHARQAVGLARVPGERLAAVPDALRRQQALSSGFGRTERRRICPRRGVPWPIT